MDIPNFEEIFKQIKTNFWIIGIPYDQYKIMKRYFVFMIVLTSGVFVEIVFFYSKLSVQNLLLLTQLAPCTFIGFLSILKMIFITMKRQNIFELTTSLNRLCSEIINKKSKWDLVKKEFIFIKYFVKYFFISNAILICIYNSLPLGLTLYTYYSKGDKIYSLPYAVSMPYVKDYWYTYLLKYTHLSAGGFICMLYTITIDALYYVMTSRVCSHFAILSDEIQDLDENTSHRLRDIVKRHQYILGLSQNLEEIFRAPNLFNVLFGSLEICSLGFSLTIGDWEQIPAIILFLLSIFLQLLMICVFGENLIRESNKIGEAALTCKWYKMDKKSKNSILLLMIRSNRPQILTAYKFSVMSHQSFTKIISTSWSYFTLLKTVYTPPENI
ncbi:unnamed protein product [Euphydryas editha]|uniref:Odorant receptor n=1 Tax=Euphydryas editha TaxID=104508 RepID=A0AAU9TNN3_EUPED|nr:unnamed protein product [Euphydryas editha]